MKINKEELLFKIFWKTKDKIVKTDDGKAELKVVLVPRFGKLGMIIWYCLDDDCEFELEDEQE